MAFVPAGRTRRPALGASPDRVVRAYRRARPKNEHGSWLANLSEAERLRFRARGTQLLGDLLTYIDADHGDLIAAERHASDYGAEAAKFGASLTDTVEGFLRYRKPFIDQLAALARRRRLDTREATALLVDAESVLDRLLVALMMGHAKS